MKSKRKITKNNFLLGFMAVTSCLAVVRLLFPSIANGKTGLNSDSLQIENNVTETLTAFGIDGGKDDSLKVVQQSYVSPLPLTTFYDAKGEILKHRIRGVVDYDESFPDSQSVQLESALKYAVRAVENRVDAESRKKELVYVGSNPFFEVKKLHNSVAYLVPRASFLLQDIGRNFFDSLQIKHIPLNKIIVTSVLRTKEDVAALQKRNGNATENSCHLYGTTFDIAYNKYSAITRPVRDDTLKWVLSEVLNDLRKQGRCYIKYEKRQGCFHITVR